MEIRGETMSFSLHKKKENDKKKESQQAANIVKLEQNLTEDISHEHEKLKLEFREYSERSSHKSPNYEKTQLNMFVL